MDILRKELNEIYQSQHLENEHLDSALLEACKGRVHTLVGLNNACAVITDAASDSCYLYGGAFAALRGISEGTSLYKDLNSSDEDLIYNRLHPEDLVEKRMLEYEFFKYVDALPGDEKLGYKATCRIRIKGREGNYLFVNNSTQILQPSPSGSIWLILCCYDLASDGAEVAGICPHIINNNTGEVVALAFSDMKKQILSAREKEILRLIMDGKPSKQIADLLNISIHTVNRHRQNILEKLSVGNSVEAIMAAKAMKLI